MLLNLHVKNFALIDEADVDFDKGLNILTGETGAGKSIILGSMNLALGAKADKDSIRNGAEFALVEMTFSIENDIQKEILNSMDIYPEDGILVIQRKILPTRSVFKVNGETVNASLVKDIANILIDVYGQHDYQYLLKPQKHIEILDSYADDSFTKLLKDYRDLYKEYLSVKEELNAPENDEVKREREVSLLKYQINEIESASLKEGEEEEIQDRLKVLENSAKIQSTLGYIKELLFEMNSSASENVDMALRESLQISNVDDRLAGLSEEIGEISNSLSEISREINDCLDDYTLDEESLDIMRERYELINDLERKYGKTIKDINTYYEEKVAELEVLQNMDEKKARLTNEFERLEKLLKDKASNITKARNKNAKEFEKSIIKSLADLNFNQADFKVEIKELPEFGINGLDKVGFTISTNPGETRKPLENVASGGELSRIMLAIKAVAANSEQKATLIFDEIDAGISGVTAWKVAEKLASLSFNHQVVCITHLQQIAAMADRHFEIKKSVSNQRTETSISVLDEEGQIKEIIRMLGDETSSETFRENALELKKRASNYKLQK